MIFSLLMEIALPFSKTLAESFNLIPGVPLDKAMNKVSEKVTELNLPSHITASFQGTAKAFQANLHEKG